MKLKHLISVGVLIGIPTLAIGQTTDDLIETGKDRLQANQSAQVSVDDVFDQTKQLEKTYQEELNILEGLNMYNQLLQKQLNDQQAEMDKLDQSINNATLVERQIVPLLVRMVNALDTFVSIDIPFLREEREQRVASLRDLLSRADLTTSEKCRRVFEAYQIENEFGYTIESYQGKVEVDNAKFAVEFLRIGRIALLYRDLSGDKVGFWNPQTRAFESLTESQYKRHITKGLRIANEEIAPELITIPLLVNMEEK